MSSRRLARPRCTSGAACVLGLVVVLTFFASGCQSGGTSEPKPPPDAPETLLPKLNVTTARLHDWPRVVRVQGSLLGDERSVVGAKVAGRVEQVTVDLGSAVRRGEVMVTLETEELDLKVQQAEAQLHQALAKLGLKPSDKEEALDPAQVPTVLQEMALWKEAQANLERARALAAERAMPVEDLEQRQAATEVAKAKYEAALNEVGDQLAAVRVRRAELALARQTRADAEIRAPFDGVVQQREVAPGTYLHVGQAVVALVKTNPLRFRAGVPEREAVRIRLGQTARVRVEGEPAPMDGKVTRISPALDTSSRSLIVELDLPNPEGRLRAGLFAEADIVLDPKAQTLAVPAGAISEFAGVEKVWLVRQNEAAAQPVLTGRRTDALVEILDGLKPGDLVVVDARQGRAGPVALE